MIINMGCVRSVVARAETAEVVMAGPRRSSLAAGTMIGLTRDGAQLLSAVDNEVRSHNRSRCLQRRRTSWSSKTTI